MKTASVVIGLNYGDEGKGLFTDYLTKNINIDEPKLVVRYNGGCQAGHTVEKANGERYVFSAFGAGTFNKVPTYYSKRFIMNPFVFMDQYNELYFKGYKPLTYIHPECSITTAFDVAINRLFENSKDLDVRGSVGIGVWETLERSRELIDIKVKDLYNEEVLERKLNSIIKYYFIPRCKDLGLKEKFVHNFLYEWKDKYVISTKFACEFLNKHTIMIDDKILDYFSDVVFEGAQGMLLDIDRDYEFGTCSHTGFNYVNEILENYPTVDIEVYYITRSYLTRHGAGPIASIEAGNMNDGYHNFDGYFKVNEKTNHFNEWQRNFRYGYLNIDSILNMVDDDSTYHFPSTKRNLVITHVDEIRTLSKYAYYEDNKKFYQEFDLMVNDHFRNEFKSILISTGPTSNDIKYY